jgi:sialate O-acetylesterase
VGAPLTPAVMWFRKEILLPDPIPAGRAMIFLGQIERLDTVYVNGNQIGGSVWVENPRAYPAPDGMLKPRLNIVAVRVLKTKPDG